MNIKIPALLLTSLAVALAVAQTTISVIVDGDPVTFGPTGPMRSNGHVLVPLRGVLEKIGATLEWDAAAQTVTAHRGEDKIELRVGKAFARINDEDVPLDTPARVFKGTTYVPLRFVGTALHAKVEWDEAKSTVIVTSKG